MSARVQRDFPQPEQQDDLVSTVSGLESEIDEWAALNKYAVLKEFYTVQQQREMQ